MRTILGIHLTTFAFAMSTSACFAVVNLDPYHVGDVPEEGGSMPGSEALGSSDAGAGATGSADLKLAFLNMTPHITQMFEYRVIDANNIIQSRGVVKPLGSPNVDINVPMAVPRVNGPYRLDFYADVTDSGKYTGSATSPLCGASGCSVLTNDHAWRIYPLDASNTSGEVAVMGDVIQVTFTHDTSFTDINTLPNDPTLAQHPPIDTGLAATITIQNATAQMGNLIQVRIMNTDDNQTVGLYRIPKISQAAFVMAVPGCVETATSYDVLVYVDANHNGMYDDPATPGAGDLGWIVPTTAGSTGLNATLDLSMTTAANKDVGAP
jgi:hypothetical protein